MTTTEINQQLNIYLVGGAVRDELLNRTVVERDYVVVGATVEQMLALGFTQVGKDFPVFLHPETKEEYALARTEKKQGVGYTGFKCYAESSVTLEQDLLRRDLTVNAMAMDSSGKIIDPYNGLLDLKNKCLRHVSSAFSEDPLRVLRIARFAARYHYLGFTIAADTLALMKKISATDELLSLSSERIWLEMHKTLSESNPEIFFTVLHECGALKTIWPELDKLWGIPNPAQWHPEVCSGIHTMMVLKQAVRLSTDISVRFAALCHDLGKGLTEEKHWPSHRGHEVAGLALVEDACKRFRVPTIVKSLALKVCEFHLHSHKAFELKANTILNMFNRLDVWRNPEGFELFILTCQADFQGRKGLEDKAYPQKLYLEKALEAAQKVTAKTFVEEGLKGKAIKEAIDQERIKAIAKVKIEFSE